MSEHKVIMPDEKDLAEMEAEGYRTQKRRGRVEMLLGLLILAFFAASLGDLFGDDSYSGSLKTSHLIAFGASGLATFSMGLSRQFKEKNRRKY